MGPYWLQSEIHSTFTGDSSFWADMRLQIENILEPLDHAHLYDGHLVREFNRKVNVLGFEDLMFSPYDGGFRFTGITVVSPDDGYVYLYTDEGNQVFTNDDQAVQVPESLANS